jgi:hypothetical protein
MHCGQLALSAMRYYMYLPHVPFQAHATCKFVATQVLCQQSISSWSVGLPYYHTDTCVAAVGGGVGVLQVLRPPTCVSALTGGCPGLRQWPSGRRSRQTLLHVGWSCHQTGTNISMRHGVVLICHGKVLYGCVVSFFGGGGLSCCSGCIGKC